MMDLAKYQVDDIAARRVAFDLTYPIQKALDSFGQNGGVLTLPPGALSFSKLVIPDGVTVRGAGQGATILYCTAQEGDGLVIAANSGLEHLTLSQANAGDSTLAVCEANAAFLRWVTLYGYRRGIDVRRGAVGVDLNSLTFAHPVEDAEAMIIGTDYSNLKIRSIIGSGPAHGEQPAAGVLLINGDTSFISDTNITLHGAALSFDNTFGRNVYATHIANSLFDSAKGHSNCEMTGSGGVYDTKFSNVWFGLGDECGLLINPGPDGIVDGVGLGNCEFVANTDSGLRVHGDRARNIFVDGGWAAGNEHGYNFSGGATHFRVNGARAGNVASRGPNRFGVTVQGGASDFYTIAANDLSGNSNAALCDAGTGTHKIVGPNLF